MAKQHFILPIDQKLHELQQELAKTRSEINDVLNSKITDFMSIACKNPESMSEFDQLKFSLRGRDLGDEIINLVGFLEDDVEKGNLNIFKRVSKIFEDKLSLISENVRTKILLLDSQFSNFILKEMVLRNGGEKEAPELSGVALQEEGGSDSI